MGKFMDISKIINRLLNMKMNEWLTTGDELRAARWLKLAYWQDGRSGLSSPCRADPQRRWDQ